MELLSFLLIVVIPGLISLIVLVALIIRDMLYWRKLLKQEAKSQPWINKYNSVKSQTNPDVTIISELYDDLPNVHDLPDIRMAMVTAVKRKYTIQSENKGFTKQFWNCWD